MDVIKSPNQRGRDPPRRRRRGACEGCKQSKVRCNGGTPCEYCERYSRTCQYNAPARRERHGSSSSIPLALTPVHTEHGFCEPSSTDIKTMSGTYAKSGFSFDLSQYRLDELGTELGEGILMSPGHGSTTSEFDAFCFDWQSTASMTTKGGDQNENESHIEPQYCLTPPPTSSGTTVREGRAPSLTPYPRFLMRNVEAYQSRLFHLIENCTILGDEDRSIAKTAMTQLLPPVHTEPTVLDLSVSCETSQQQICNRLLDEDWRRTRIRAAFDVHTGLGDFLYESEINNLASETLSDKMSTRTLSQPLVLGVIAVGCSVLEDQSGFVASTLCGSQQIFIEACVRMKEFLLGYNSLIKLQALATLVTMSLRGNFAITLDLIASATTCVRILGASPVLPSDKLNLDLAMGAVVCLQHQATTIVSSNEFTDNFPESLRGPNTDFRTKWMASQVEYSRILSDIAESDKEISNDEDLMESLARNLEAWKAGLMGEYHDIDRPYPRNLIGDTRKVWLFCQFHDAQLQLLRPHESGASGGFYGTAALSTPTLNSARVLLEAASLLPPPAALSNRKVVGLVSLATCLIFARVLCNPKENNLVYLGMASGFFARLSTITVVPFSAATSLLYIAEKLDQSQR